MKKVEKEKRNAGCGFSILDPERQKRERKGKKIPT